MSCSGDLSSVHQDNPLYEEQEIRMEMFNEGSDEETEGTKCSCLVRIKFYSVVCRRHRRSKTSSSSSAR